MVTAENIFRFFVRIIFLFAYGAFLWASIHHIAFFYHNFEGTSDWTGPYALAISIDVTSLVLAAGLMFFSRNMAWHTVGAIGFFVLFLTAFSWLVNWEYAARFQTTDLTASPVLHMVNPVLASSFAFLNLAYSIVSGVFTAKPKTAEEMAKEADRLEALEEAQKRIKDYQDRNHKPSLIHRTKETLKEAKAAYIEVRNDGVKTKVKPDEPEQQTEPLGVPIPEVKRPEPEQQNDEQLAFAEDVLNVLKAYPRVHSWLAGSQRTATIDEIAEITGQSKRRLLNRVNDGTLKRASRNAQLIRISSVMAWLKVAPLPSSNDGNTGEMAALKVVGKR